MKTPVDIKLNQIADVLVFSVVMVLSGSILAAPELKVIAPEGPAHPNRVYRIEYEVSWTGDPAECAVLPAAMESIDWATVTLSGVRAFVREGVNVVSQTLEIIPNKTGEFTLPEVRISYLNPEATPPAESAAHGTVPSDSSASPSLRADPFTIMVRPDRISIWIFGGLGASLLLTALGWRFARRWLRKPQPTLAPQADWAAAQSALHTARQRRLDGNFYEFYLELARAACALPAAEGPRLAETFKARGQDVGYKGVRPTDDQMDGDVRELERAIAQQKENAPS